jgi:hypothetical protein
MIGNLVICFLLCVYLLKLLYARLLKPPSPSPDSPLETSKRRPYVARIKDKLWHNETLLLLKLSPVAAIPVFWWYGVTTVRHAFTFSSCNTDWGHVVAQLVEALCYKPDGRGIESRWGGFFQFTLSFKPHYGPGIDSASNRNEYQESF